MSRRARTIDAHLDRLLVQRDQRGPTAVQEQRRLAAAHLGAALDALEGGDDAACLRSTAAAVQALEAMPNAQRWDSLALMAARLGIGKFKSPAGAHQALRRAIQKAERSGPGHTINPPAPRRPKEEET